MKCPACGKSLKTVTVGGVEIDACQGGCEGIWLDRRELNDKEDALQAFGEHRRRQLDMLRAREIQRSLLPHSTPRLDGFTIDHECHPTRHVGGDFYDFLPTESGGLIGILADVSGKGVSAALLASLVQGALRMQFTTFKSCDAAFKRLNGLLCDRILTGNFVTMFAAVLTADGEGHYVSAGHEPAYIYRAANGRLDELPSTGLVLGAFGFAAYDRSPINLQDGDILVVYSDGVTDAEGPSGHSFGKSRLCEVMLNEASGGCPVLKTKLLDALDAFTRGTPQNDDVTFMLIEKKPVKAHP